MEKVLQLRLGTKKGSNERSKKSEVTKSRQERKKKVGGENQNGSETAACRLTRMR